MSGLPVVSDRTSEDAGRSQYRPRGSVRSSVDLVREGQVSLLPAEFSQLSEVRRRTIRNDRATYRCADQKAGCFDPSIQ